jgi:hypothetical protein
LTDIHVLEASRYVVLNPVRARLCSRPVNWMWSSHRATAGLEDAPAFLTTSWLLGQFAENVERARAFYRRFVADGIPLRGAERGRPGRSCPGSDPGDGHE